MNSTQRLMRSSTDKMIAGVAGGIAQYFAIDPVIVRLIFVVTAFSGIGLLLYPVLWVLMPLSNSQPTYVSTESGARQPRFDPMTGQPFDPGQEIPIQNVNPTAGNDDVQTQRSRTLGLIMLAVGLFFILKMLPLGWIAPFVLPALLIGAGVYLLRRTA